MAKKRRTDAEVAAAIAEVDELIAGGLNITDATDKVGLSQSVYQKHKSGERGKRVKGKIDVSSLPPRPKKGGKRPPRPVNLHDVQSVATRISRIDRKLKEFTLLTNERHRLALHLMGMLDPEKQKKK